MCSSEMVALSQPPSQADLVRAWQAGDPAAWAEVLRAYKPLLVTICWRILRNEQDAEEIVHDTLLAAHRGLPWFRGDCQLSSWLAKIATNRARNRYHYWRRRHRGDWADIEDPSIVAQLADGRLTPGAQAELTEIEEACHRGLQAVGPRSRALLEHRARGLRYVEIGRRMGMELGTVKSSIARARHELREKAGLC